MASIACKALRPTESISPTGAGCVSWARVSQGSFKPGSEEQGEDQLSLPCHYGFPRTASQYCFGEVCTQNAQRPTATLFRTAAGAPEQLRVLPAQGICFVLCGLFKPLVRANFLLCTVWPVQAMCQRYLHWGLPDGSKQSVWLHKRSGFLMQ